MDRKVVALGYCVHDGLEIAKVEARVNTLHIEVQCEVDEMNISRMLAIAKQTAFNTLPSSEHPEFNRCYSSTLIIVGISLSEILMQKYSIWSA